MAGAMVNSQQRGLTSTPAMDFESSEMTAPSNLVLGNSNPTTLQAITINSAGGTSPQIQVWRLASSGSSLTSASRALLGHPPGAAGLTFWYNAAAQNGWIINWQSGIGDLTVTYRENQ